MDQRVNLSRKPFLTAFLVLFICTMLVAALFLIFSFTKYNERVVSAGAETFSSVTETAAYRLQGQLSHQWNVLNSFSAFLRQSDTISEESLLFYMSSNRSLWNLRELAIRTESGRHYNSYGNEFFLDEDVSVQRVLATDLFLTDANDIHMIHPIHSINTFNGEHIQTIIASQNISTLLYSIMPKDYSGQLQAYLMNMAGDRLNDDFHDSAFTDSNLISFVETHSPFTFGKKNSTVSAAVQKHEYWLGTISVNNTQFYVSFTPVECADTYFYLITAIESSYVISNNTRFGEHILFLSLILIALSLSVALLSFITFHRKNKEYVENLLITNQRDSDDKLEAALELAQQSNAAKTAFLSSMSHDIRTPMNAIINMTDFALKEIDDKNKVLEYLNVIRTSSTHLLHLINDVLDMTHIESGKMVLKHDPFNLSSITDDVSQIISAAASKKKIAFSSRIISLDHDKLRGDALRLQQVLINLLNNAVKFTPEGGTVVLTIEEISSTKHNYRGYRFTITDTGYGISPETLDTIFEPFKRIENKGLKIEGSGLGLAITKSIVDAMGGDITVQSTPDVGSIFTVRLFFEIDDNSVPNNVYDASVAEENPEETVVNDFKNIRVLVAEDIAINQQILNHLMQNVNIVCDFANDGKEAVEKFVKSDPFWYSMIFMDIQMPEMNGYEATREIRLSNHAQANIIPIVAMTANVFDEDVDKCRAAGMNAHLGKPIDPDALIKTISTLTAE